MHTPGPWRRVPAPADPHHADLIEIAEGEIARIARWPRDNTMAEANARLIEHAPDMADALRDLVAWNALLGHWDAPCWERARRIHDRAAGSLDDTPGAPARTASGILADDAFADQAWTEETQLLLLLDFLDDEQRVDPTLAGRLHAFLRAAASA